MKVMRRFFAIAGLVGAASSAFSYDFSEADLLFSKRGEGQAAIEAARAAYEASLKTVTGRELIYAVEYLSRLDYYEGLRTDDVNLQKVIYSRCLERIEMIKPPAPTSTPEYYYFKGGCLGSWAKANGVLQSLIKSKELVDTLETGKKIAPAFEGGGFDRIEAPVFLKLPAINPYGPTGDKKKALAFAEAALASSAYSGSVEPDTGSGDYFFNAFEYKAEILDALGRKAEAIDLLNNAIARIDAGDISTFRVPETMEHRRGLQALLEKLSK
jgi:hypothetical protein